MYASTYTYIIYHDINILRDRNLTLTLLVQKIAYPVEYCHSLLESKLLKLTTINVHHKRDYLHLSPSSQL